jgi:hypothetical protein
VYEKLGQFRAETYAGHVEYGKWLIASLLAVHGGAIFAISGLKDAVKPEQLAGLVNAAAFNLGGVFLTLLAGFGAWLNFQFANTIYERWQTPKLLYRGDALPRDNERGAWKVGATLWVSAAVGIAASLCFVASAILVVCALKSA